MLPTWFDYQLWLKPLLSHDISDLIRTLPPPRPTDWSTDSRSVQNGQWFIPLVGANFDGHRYIEKALANGATGFLYHEEFPLPTALKHRGIAVSDTLRSYQYLAKGWRQSLKNLCLFGITGSNGKTTTKELLAAILRRVGQTLATESNFNNEIGVPKTLLTLSPNDNFAVLELGARKPGNIRELVEISLPNVSCLLNAGMAHIGIFGSAKALRETKLEIFNYAPHDAKIIAPQDDGLILQSAQGNGRDLLSFGQLPEAGVRVRSLETDTENFKLRFCLDYHGKSYSIVMPTIHQVVALNAAAAFAMAVAAGVDVEQIVSALNEFGGVKGRFQVTSTPDFTLIDDAYNANPNSMAAGLESIARFKQNRPLVLILGDMLELGQESETEHINLGKTAGKLLPAKLLLTGNCAQIIKEGALSSGMQAANIQIFSDYLEILNHFKAHPFPWFGVSPLIYVKASNGIKLYEVVQSLKQAK